MTRSLCELFQLVSKGGFNPPFDSARFPNTPFTFDPMEVDAIEFGVKATVPEVGLVANASIYYNDFDNYHVSVIRNETGINEGMPVENYGAELELLLNPPTVPGLTFNFMMITFLLKLAIKQLSTHLT